MKIGLIAVNVGGPEAAENLVNLARKAEQVGLDSLWTFEHVIVPLDYQSRYPYHRSGKFPASPETSFIDPLIALSHVAGVSKSLRLGTGINIVPQTNPLLLAKQAASLDYLSGGRLMLGVGAGWLAEEFQAMGTPFEGRGSRFDDYLVAMKKVWSGEVVEHQSEYLQWSGFKSYPLPAQKPHMPLIIGGTSGPALKRVVTHGDGWISVGEPDVLQDCLTRLANFAADAGRDMSAIEITSVWIYVKEGADSLSRYEDMGVARLLIPWQALGEPDPISGLDKLGEQVLARL
ncbi:MAG: LLM class F420-dependent oxidoreductase [SAR324 cluster bacterium]|nr:LLM class F420-dependent oxidoreductase [SAR324 cluster bacterium]